MQATAQRIEDISRLERLRLALNLTQKQLGDKIGMAKNSISQVESGRRALTIKTVYAIQSKFPNVNPGWLLRGDGEMFLNKPDKNGSPIEMLGATQLEMAEMAVAALADKQQDENEAALESTAYWKAKADRLDKENLELRRRLDAVLDLVAESRGEKK